MANDIPKLGASLPSNSHNNEERHHIEPVVQGKATTRSSMRKKLGDTFIQEDMAKVKNYVIFDLIIPGIKDTIVDIIEKSLQMLFYGKVKGSGKDRGTGYTEYGRYAKPNSQMGGRSSRDSSQATSWDTIYFETRADASQVLDILIEQLRLYGRASIGDLYDASNVTNMNYANENYGWTDLQSARVMSDRHGYYIDLPRPKQLD